MAWTKLVTDCRMPEDVEAFVLSRPADDSELLIEDVEEAARAVEDVLRRHLGTLATRTARYETFSALAARLEAALAG